MTAIEISATLQQLVDAFADSYFKSGEIAAKILEQAQLEGLSKEQTRELVISALKKRGLADRTIRAALPANLKDSHARILGNKGNKSGKRQFPKETIAAVNAAAPLKVCMSPARWRGLLFTAANQGFDVLLTVQESYVVGVEKI